MAAPDLIAAVRPGGCGTHGGGRPWRPRWRRPAGLSARHRPGRCVPRPGRGGGSPRRRSRPGRLRRTPGGGQRDVRIGPALVGLDVDDQAASTPGILGLDPDPALGALGGNAAVATSMAVAWPPPPATGGRCGNSFGRRTPPHRPVGAASPRCASRCPRSRSSGAAPRGEAPRPAGPDGRLPGCRRLRSGDGVDRRGAPCRGPGLGRAG